MNKTLENTTILCVMAVVVGLICLILALVIDHSFLIAANACCAIFNFVMAGLAYRRIRRMTAHTDSCGKHKPPQSDNPAKPTPTLDESEDEYAHPV